MAGVGSLGILSPFPTSSGIRPRIRAERVAPRELGESQSNPVVKTMGSNPVGSRPEYVLSNGKLNAPGGLGTN